MIRTNHKSITESITESTQLAEPRTHIIGGRTTSSSPSPTSYLAKRLVPVEFITNKAAKYLESVKDTMPRLNWNLYNDSVQTVSRAGILAAEILKIADGLIVRGNDAGVAGVGLATITQYLSSTSSLFDKLDELELCLDQLIALFSGSIYEELAIYGKSTTAASAMTDEKNAITSWHNKYTSFDDMTLLETLLNNASVDTNKIPAFEFVTTAKSINKFTIGVIGALMRGASGAMLNRLKSMIETQKDTILDATREDISNLTGIHGMVVRYSLTPTTSSQLLPELFAVMKLVYVTDESPSGNFARIAVGSLGIIVIHKESKSPIEYNLRGLLDEQYILREGLNNAPMAGLNKKTIRKYNTAVMLPVGSEHNRGHQDSIGAASGAVPRAGARETYNIDRATHVYVFETITNGYYRTLGFAGETKMPIARVYGLLHGLTSRPQQYNLRQFEVIREVCFDDRAEYVLTQYENEKNVPASSGPIRTAISDRMIEVFRESLRVVPKSPSAFRKHLPRHDVINEIIVDVLAAAAGIGANRPAEFIVTCIARFNSIVHRFTKDIERRWASRDIPVRIFDDYEGDTLRHELMALFRETLTATIEELDKSHAWTEYDISIKEFVLGTAT